VREVVLDCSHRDEQRLGDLGIRHSLSCQLTDSSFARRERFDAGERRAAGAGTCNNQLLASPHGKRVGPTAVSKVESLP
jgi:hypothetical protein